jgi:ATP-dependent DNA helicase RecQ
VKNEKNFDRNIWAKEVKKRDNYTCQYSLNDKYRKHDGPIEAHHIQPIRKGGKNVLSNGITLCKYCHAQFLIEAEQRYYANVMKKFYLLIRDFVRKLVFLKPEARYYELLGYLTEGRAHQFRPMQLEVIRGLAERQKNVIFVTPTGSGKSLIYELYGLWKQTQMLVLTPLISLQRDRVQQLWKRWIPTTYINSELNNDDEEKKKRLSNIMKKAYSFVFAHPKQFLVENSNTDKVEIKFNNLLSQADFSAVCIDEVHVVDLWGKQFIKEYGALKTLLRYFHYPQTIMLSASLTKRQQELIADSLFPPKKRPEIFVTGFYRSEISLNVINTSEYDQNFSSRLEAIDELIENNPDKKIIIFATTKKQVESIRDYLINQGHEVGMYHSGMEKDKKNNIQDQFAGKDQPELNILVCTSAFGMGINIPNIRIAIHYSFPFSINDYYQQFGRIGRDGEPSEAYLLNDEDEKFAVIDFIKDKEFENIEDPDKQEKAYKDFEQDKQDLLNYISSDDKWRFILDYFGEKPRSRSNFWKIVLILIILIYLTLLLIE